MNITRLRMLQGWRRNLLCMLLGICATAALPPIYALPLLIPACAGLFLLTLAAQTKRQAFFGGWWWGLGYFTAGLYWICISLYVEPDKFAWLTPFALFGLPSVLGIYTGIVTWLLYSFSSSWRLSAPLKIVLFAWLWLLVEYVRAYLFSGFPWNLIGYSWTVSNITLQLASIIGVYGLGWLTVLLATLPALLLLKEPAKASYSVALLIIVLWLGFGAWRLAEHPTVYTSIPVRVVQADIPETMRMTPELMFEGIKKHLRLTMSTAKQQPSIIIWPEASIPDAELAHDIGTLLPKDSLLLAGAVRYAGTPTAWQAWNSLLAISSSGDVVAGYDKHHLVPFGEYIPLRRILPVENIAGGLGDFSRGSGPTTLQIGVIPPFSPLICYEAIFPAEATDGTHRAEWLLNITNDAWFGDSSGPYQHLQAARMRAVEQGLPLVRAANTGISAYFDPLGRELARLSVNQKGVLDGYLPSAHNLISIYGRLPFATILLLIVFSGIFALLCRAKKINHF